MPVGILAFNQVDLPLPVPALQLLLARDGGADIAELLEPDEAMDVVAACEALDLTVSMLPKSRDQIAGNADVKRAVRLAGKDVDARVALERHERERVEKWTLKQVQGDEIERTLPEVRHAELGSASIVPSTLP